MHQPKIMGVDYDGAWAEYVAVPYPTLCSIPDSLPFEQAALMADAIGTPYAALVDTARLRPSQSVGLWGIGGLGFHAVQIALPCGAAPVIAIDPRPSARQRALDVGADAALDPLHPDFDELILSLTDGLGLDLAVDFVGSNHVLRQADASLARGGKVMIVGLTQDDIHLGPSERFGIGRHQLLGSLGYKRRHLEQVANLVRRGRLGLSQLVSATYSLRDIEKGIAHLTSPSSDAVRIVILP
ncbi:MAG: hypothetical protein QOJ95_4207 [Mycobacterium sp.]|nr:hypothetical protein [Mycobacterium sp.]